MIPGAHIALGPCPARGQEELPVLTSGSKLLVTCWLPAHSFVQREISCNSVLSSKELDPPLRQMTFHLEETSG